MVLRQLDEKGLLRDAATVSGLGIKKQVEHATSFNADVIRDTANPLVRNGGIAVLKGNLAPLGALIKVSAASPELLRHTGPAFVFDTIEDYHARIDDPDLDVMADSVLVLRNCGPKGYPGMAEVGNMGLPEKLLKQGVRDMVRISDARMSGTAFGTVVLHTAPEGASGGPIALVETGDLITLDVGRRSLDVHVGDDTLAQRRAQWTPPPVPMPQSGWQKLYVDHVLQADRGVDLDFLVGKRGADVPRESH